MRLAVQNGLTRGEMLQLPVSVPWSPPGALLCCFRRGPWDPRGSAPGDGAAKLCIIAHPHGTGHVTSWGKGLGLWISPWAQCSRLLRSSDFHVGDVRHVF